MKWNFKVVETIPLYDNYSSKAITKTKVIWELYDSVLDKTLKEFEIYSYFENNEFKILNPEYIFQMAQFLLFSLLLQNF